MPGAEGLILVTNNLREFPRMPGVRLENSENPEYRELYGPLKGKFTLVNALLLVRNLVNLPQAESGHESR